MDQPNHQIVHRYARNSLTTTPPPPSFSSLSTFTSTGLTAVMTPRLSATQYPSGSFLLLPPEIRNEVYRLAFDSLHLVISKTPNGCSAIFCNRPLALLAASKQIHDERVAYKYHNLEITTFYDFLPGSDAVVAYYIAPNGPTMQAFAHAKYINITDPITGALEFGVRMHKMPCPLLHELTITLTAGKSYSADDVRHGGLSSMSDRSVRNVSHFLQDCISHLKMSLGLRGAGLVAEEINGGEWHRYLAPCIPPWNGSPVLLYQRKKVFKLQLKNS